MAMRTKITCPNGFNRIKNSQVFWVVKEYSGRILLCEFFPPKDKKRQDWNSNLSIIAREHLEDHIELGNFKIDRQADFLPPHLGGRVTWEELGERYRSIASDANTADRRKLLVEDIPAIIEDIIEPNEVFKKLNEIAKFRRTVPQRFRYWVMTLLCFGDDPLVFMTTSFRKGKHCRDEATVKQGRPSLHGLNYGAVLNAKDREIINESYRRNAGFGKNLTDLYKIFCSELIKDSKAIHRDQKGQVDLLERPIPSLYQFRARVIEEFGEETIYLKRFGRQKLNNKKKVPLGKYSDSAYLLMQVCEADAYHHEVTPIGITGNELQKLVVVHIVDRTSSMIIGIGFSIGGEERDAYRMAQFCAAIDKQLFLSLFGIDNKSLVWKSQGLGPELQKDRGPAPTSSNVIPVSSLSPSHDPQNKAVVETSNPKKDKVGGAPTYSPSRLSPIDVMRKSIYYALERNDTLNVSDKVDSDFIAKGLIPTPNVLWSYLEGKNRISGRIISLAEACREFLHKEKAKITREALIFKGLRYRANDPVFVSLLQEATKGTKYVDVYYLPMIISKIFLPYKREVLELSQVLHGSAESEDIFITSDERDFLVKQKNKANSVLKPHKAATGILHSSAEAKTNGKASLNVQRITGTSKGNKRSAKNESKSWKN